MVISSSARKEDSARTVPCDLPVHKLCMVGDPVSIQSNTKKFHSVFRGAKEHVYAFSQILSGAGQPLSEIAEPGYILTDIPIEGGKAVTFEFNAPFTFRFLTRGIVYGFKTYLIRVHPKPFLSVFEYPSKIEKYPLRKSERVEMVIPASASWPEGASEETGAILDISPCGAGIALRNNIGFATGSMIRLSFVLPDGVPVESCMAEVRNIRRENDKSYFGVRFTGDDGKALGDIRRYCEESALAWCAHV